jgi:heme/copper-type cytochrome/quinol oxidase subunit 4
MKKLDIKEVLTEGVGIGIKNIVSLVLATILYVITVWIPYLNVGTTIAMCSIPVELSKGNIINPTFIFDAKFRKNMGEFFILIGLEAMAMIPAFLMGIIPGIVLSYAWAIAILLFIDKDVHALDALRKSNELTYGNKWRMFFIGLILSIALSIVTAILGLIPAVGGILSVIVMILYYPIQLGCNAVIYKKLTTPEEEVKAE